MRGIVLLFPFVFTGCAAFGEVMQDFGEAVAEQAAVTGTAVAEAVEQVASGGGIPAWVVLGGAVGAFVAGVIARVVYKRRTK